MLYDYIASMGAISIHADSKTDMILAILRRKDIDDISKLAYASRIKPSVLYSDYYALEMSIEEFETVFKYKFF